MVGLSTDVTSSVANPLERRHERRRMLARKAGQEAEDRPAGAADGKHGGARLRAAERGHMFNVKPISQQGAPLRMSRLPG